MTRKAPVHNLIPEKIFWLNQSIRKQARTRPTLMAPKGKLEKKSRRRPAMTIIHHVFSNPLKMTRSRKKIKTKLGLAPLKLKKPSEVVWSVINNKRMKMNKIVFFI